MIFNLIWYWLQRWTPTQKFNLSFLYTIKWQGRIFQDGCDIVNIIGIWKIFLWLWHFFAYYYYLLSYIIHKPSIDLMKVVENFIPQKYSEIQLSTNNPEEVYQTNLNCLTMFYVVVASFTLKNIQQLSKLSEIYYRSQQNKYPENLATIYFIICICLPL